MMFVLIGAVSASEDVNVTNDDNLVGESEDAITTVPAESDDIYSQSEIISNKTANFEVSDDTNYLSKSTFDVKLVDENGTGIANETVTLRINGVNSDVDTDENGTAKLNLSSVPKGTYTAYYKFVGSGYKSVASSSKLLVLSSGISQIKGSNYVAYYGATNYYTVTLTVDGMPLANRDVTFRIHGVNYVKKTNSKGQATLKIGLVKGKYTVWFSYYGEKNIKKSSGKAVVTVKKGMPVSITKANSVTYKHKVSAPFEVKLKDARGNLLVKRYVKFTINKKTYKVKTNSKGIAKINIKQSAGTYKVKVVFPKVSFYKASSKTFTIKVRSYIKNGGIWLFAYDMDNVNFKSLKKYGVNNIFLNYYAIEKHGQSYVEKYIAKAGKYGLKVHIWMQVFYNGKWQNPTVNGKINYNMIKSKVNEAKKYAKVKGAAGVHFDYIRFPGNAYKYANGANAVSYFTKQACNAIHKINPKLIVSAAIMPEPSGNKYYYGQDVPTMSKYLDVLLPMVYKGNYNAGTGWIKSVTSTLVKQSNGAKVWTGLQSYVSDDNVKPLSASELKKDTLAAIAGGAAGIVFFRHGLTNYFSLTAL